MPGLGLPRSSRVRRSLRPRPSRDSRCGHCWRHRGSFILQNFPGPSSARPCVTGAGEGHQPLCAGPAGPTEDSQVRGPLRGGGEGRESLSEASWPGDSAPPAGSVPSRHLSPMPSPLVKVSALKPLRASPVRAPAHRRRQQHWSDLRPRVTFLAGSLEDGLEAWPRQAGAVGTISGHLSDKPRPQQSKARGPFLTELGLRGGKRPLDGLRWGAQVFQPLASTSNSVSGLCSIHLC